MRVMRIGLFLFYVMGDADVPAHNDVAWKAPPACPARRVEVAAPVQVF
ncbi:hypothetical protein [Herbaspirillum hiltneri]|nr:hypothetical protein [Herbaspirillum hiltneri]